MRASYGTLFKYIKNVATASEGCVTDEINADLTAVGAFTPPAVPAAEASSKVSL